MWIIYKTKNLKNDKIYIGQHKVVNVNTLDPWYIGSGYVLKQAIAKNGLDSFERVVITTCTNQDEANRLEELYIQKYNSRDPSIGYNLAMGGRNFGSSIKWIKENDHERWTELRQKFVINGLNSKTHFKVGHKLSKESIEKMRSNLPKKRSAMSGETKLKISAANKGRASKLKGTKSGPLSKEHKEKLSLAKIGKKLTEEHKKKISLSMINYRAGKL